MRPECIAEMRDLLESLVKGDDAGMNYDEWGSQCLYCHDGGDMYEIRHQPDCPITRSRTLLAIIKNEEVLDME